MYSQNFSFPQNNYYASVTGAMLWGASVQTQFTPPLASSLTQGTNQAQTLTLLQGLLQATLDLCGAWRGSLGQFSNQGQGGVPYSGSYGSQFTNDWSGVLAATSGSPWNQGPNNAQNASLAMALNFGYQGIPGQSQKMWDVWFDSKQGQNTVQRSPLVLDLNKNGKADITGKNITGDGKIDGPTTLFDLDPNQISYEFKSQQRRPGSGAPGVDGGHWVDAQGNAVSQGPPRGNQPKFNGYRYLDKSGNLIGEMKDGLYNYGKQEKREATEWLAKDGGDGFLVADFNGDGEINSSVELFGTEGANGQKFQNGYEKLAALFDRNHDGKIAGAEMQGLQIWADTNADGKVQKGELQSLQQHDISSLDVSQFDRASMQGSFDTGGSQVSYLQLALALSGYGQQAFPLIGAFFPGQPYAQPPASAYF